MSELTARIRTALGVTEDSAESRRAAVERRLSAPPAPPLAMPADGAGGDSLLELFCRKLEAHHATAALLAARQDAPGGVADWLAAEGQPFKAVIAPALADLDWSPLDVEARAPDAADTVGVSEAALGIAETGSLVLHADPDNPLTLAFTPEFHIVVLAAAAIAGPIEAAWAWQRRRFPDRPPQSLTLVSGPSRTADIEQTMYLGAHGPKRLHVLIYGVDPAQPKRPR